MKPLLTELFASIGRDFKDVRQRINNLEKGRKDDDGGGGWLGGQLE